MSELPEGISPAEPPAPRESALAIVLRSTPGGEREVLLGLRSRRSRFMPGHLAFPGGRLDPLDRPAEPGAHARCASRELLEEANLDLPPETWLEAGERVTPPLFPVRFRTQFFVAELSGLQAAAKPEPANAENEELRFAPARQILEEWEAGTSRVPPPVLPILRVLATETGSTRFEIARQVAEVNLEEERAPRVEFFPGVWVLPMRTPTLPPASHTNVWMLGARRFMIVDPGSDDPAELARLLRLVERRRRQDQEPSAILLTHGHCDHCGGATALARALGLRVFAHPLVLAGLPAAVPCERVPLDDGGRLDVDGLTVRVLSTPGHAPGHLAFYLEEPRLLIGGDLLSGLSTILIDPLSGDMGAYLESLARVRQLGCRAILPGHGPPLEPSELDRVLEHRASREARILDILEAGGASLSAIARQVYADVPAMPAKLTENQTLSHLLWLERRGRARREDAAGGSWSQSVR